MRIMKTNKVTRTVKILDKVICDLCGKESKNGSWENDIIKEKHNYYSHFGAEIEIKMKLTWSGNWADSGGYGETHEYDVCPSCFLEKIEPLFDKKRVKEYDW